MVNELKNLTRSEILGEVLISSSQIKKRVAELGKEITQDYQRKNLLLISILRGGLIFLVDLMREIDLPLSIDFMGISTYGFAESSSGV
ncbi:MAG: hypoxanthine phosphoribosyltransferase, partial [Actinobacteria bacterium]|nr:hypoxanthine phosphoribosyltransferase [Actinomycetota bacterium]